MSLAKRLARGVLHGMGGLSGMNLLRHRNRGRFRILMYHRFRAGVTEQLHRQLTAFRSHYQVLSLGEIADILDRSLIAPRHDNSSGVRAPAHLVRVWVEKELKSGPG